MKQGIIQIYEDEIRFQCQCGIRSFEIMESILAIPQHTPEKTFGFWMAVQGFLIAAGNVSKLLFSTGTKNARGQKLCNVLGIHGDSILRDRTL